MPFYHLHELQFAAFTPMRLMAEAMQTVYSHPLMPVAYTRFGRTVAAGAELIERSTRRFEKPEFGLASTVVDGKQVAVREVPILVKPFSTLLHFKRDGVPAGRHPRLLVVAPMSGHWATLLRGTIETLLPEHDVYVTDWHNARDVSASHGAFGLDDYIDYVMEFMRLLGPEVHVLAVCQPAVPVLAATALLEEDDDPRRPRSVTLMGGPIDTRINPTKVNEFAQGKTIDWFENHVVTTVPFMHPGSGRRVYPGFLQLQGFMSLNLERHVGEHVGLFHNLVHGDGDSAEQHRKFYDEYLAVMDLPADFYLDTIKKVFLEHHLPEGTLEWRGRPVRPQAITRTALFTIEGEKDDITGVGQTEAAQRLCISLAPSLRRHHVQSKVGHYGMFNGRRWREEIYPHVRDFIKTHDA